MHDHNSKGSSACRYVFFFNQIGFTALHLASQNGHLEVVKLLTKEMAQVDISTKVW